MALGDYNSGNPLKEGQIRISPSQVSMLSDNELGWYKSNVLGERNPSNTAMRLGTLTHYMCSCYLLGEFQPSDVEIVEWLDRENETDQWRVIDDAKLMAKCFKDNWECDGDGLLSEHWVEYEPNEKLILSGTADIITDDTVWDIKTTSKAKSSIGDYWMQLYTLAYIMRMNGRDNINNIGVIYLSVYDGSSTFVSKSNMLKSKKYDEVKEYIYWEGLNNEGKYEIKYKKPSYTPKVEPIDEDKMTMFIDWLKTKVKKINYAKEHDMVDILLSSNLLSFRV